MPSSCALIVRRSPRICFLLHIPMGAARPNFFTRFGYRLEQWEQLADALRQHGARHAVVKTVESSYGTRYAVDGPLESPDRRNPKVRTVWLLERDSTAPRLITAFPLEEEL